MIPIIDKKLDQLGCWQAPIIDAVSEVVFVCAGVASAYGLYLAATGTYSIKVGDKEMPVGELIGTGILGLFTTAYAKSTAHAVTSQCKI